MILQGFDLLIGAVSIFLKVIEKRLSKKVQKHEKQKTLVEMQANGIRNMVSKALSDNEISEVEFQKILTEITKWNKKYRKVDEVDLYLIKIIADLVFSKPGSKPPEGRRGSLGAGKKSKSYV